MNSYRHRLFAVAAFGLALSPLAHAQTARPSAAPAPKSEDTITLTEFVVAEKPERGYIASESITGTRVATQIKDLPFSVSVITSEFMNDFDFFDLASDMAYTASLTGVDTQGNATLRGFNSTFQLRNGFYNLGLVDRVNVDRIEVIKGPNAAIYGSTSPAGLINIVTKRPKFTPSQKISLIAGSNQRHRAEINVGGPLGSLGGVKLAYLFSANIDNVHADSTFGFSRNRLLDGNILAKFPDGSTLNLELEWSKRKVVSNDTSLPWEYIASTKKYTGVVRRDLANFSQGGPDAVANRERTAVNLVYDKRYNSVWSTHAGAMFYARHAFNFNNGSTDLFDPTTGKFNSHGTVQLDPLDEDGGAVQVDTLADYSLMNGQVKNKTLLTLDYQQNWRYRMNAQADGALKVNPVAIVNPDYSLPPRSAYVIVTRNDRSRWDVKGLFLRQQTSLFNERLLLFGGLRRDIVTYNLWYGNQYNTTGSKNTVIGSVKTPGRVDHYTDTAWSPNFGANYKLTHNVSVYGSHSTSFSPQGQVAKVTDRHLANETSVGWDYGLKCSFLDDRLVFTAGGYYIDRDGVKTSVTDPVTLVKENQSAGKWNSKGVEFEGSYRVSNDLTLTASYSHANVRIVYNGDKLTDIGRIPPGVPIDQASFVFKYSFRGVLRGLSWNHSLVYLGRAYPFSTDTDFRRDVHAPGTVVMNSNLGYSWKKGAGGYSHSIRFGVKNLLDRDFVTPDYNLGAPRTYALTYTLSH